MMHRLGLASVTSVVQLELAELNDFHLEKIEFFMLKYAITKGPFYSWSVHCSPSLELKASNQCLLASKVLKMITKGQFISKCLFGVINSSKKRT